MVAQITLKMIQYFDGDVKRINHALKVYGFAKTIGTLEGLKGQALETLELTALLHDIGIKEAERKWGSSSGKYQEMEGPEVAMTLLKDFQVETSGLERIGYLIGHHHSYACIDGVDFQSLVEADFLVNIEEDQMNADQVAAVKDKYFKTETGIELLKCYYMT